MRSLVTGLVISWLATVVGCQRVEERPGPEAKGTEDHLAARAAHARSSHVALPTKFFAGAVIELSCPSGKTRHATDVFSVCMPDKLAGDLQPEVVTDWLRSYARRALHEVDMDLRCEGRVVRQVKAGTVEEVEQRLSTFDVDRGRLYFGVGYQGLCDPVVSREVLLSRQRHHRDGD